MGDSSPMNLNDFTLQAASEQGWLNEEQVAAARQALHGDPSISVMDYLLQQGWVGVDHVAWLEASAAPCSSRPSSDSTVSGAIGFVR